MVDRIDQLEVDLKVISRMTPYAAIQYIRKSVGYDLFLNEYAIKRKMKLEDLQELIREMEERAKEFKTIEEWFAHIENIQRNCGCRQSHGQRIEMQCLL